MSGTSSLSPVASSNNAVSSTTPPPQFLDAYTKLLNQAGNVAAQPLQQYSGQTVAPLTNNQNTAIGEVQNSQGIAQPYIDAAQSHFNAATTPLWNGLPQFSSGQVQQFESPYTSDVVNATQAQFDNQNRQAAQRLAGSEVASGAWGNDRNGIAAAELANQQQLAQAPVIAGLKNQGYTQALNEFNQQQQSHLGANEANAWLNSQAGFGTAALGNQALNSSLTGANALLSAGGLQQQQNQAGLNVPYQQFLQQQAYPFQTTNFLAGIAEGTGSAAGGTGSSSTTSNPSLLSTVGGLAQTGLGLYGLTNGFNFGSSAGDAALTSSLEGSSLLSGANSALDSLFSGGYFLKRGGTVPQARAHGGIANAVNDNGHYPQPQRATGTGGIRGYADGSDIEDVPTPTARPFFDPTAPTTGMYAPHYADAPMARGISSGIATPLQMGATTPGGIAGDMPDDRYKPKYTPPSGSDRSAASEDIRSRAPYLALLQSGLGALASGNLGKGGMQGMQTYEQQMKEAQGIDEKAAEAADTGAYRSASLDMEGVRLGDAAKEAQARLKQADELAHMTDARERARDAATQKYQMGLLANDAQMRRDTEAGEWKPYGTDPVTQKPVLINTRSGQTKLGDDATTGKASGASGMSGRESVYFDRIASSANMATKAMANIMELPYGTTRGVFGGRSQGSSLVAAAKEDLANALTGDEAQGYNVMMAGVNRNLGAIETAGLAVPGSMTHSMDAMVIKEGDKGSTVLRKMAEMRQIVEEGLAPQLSKPNLPPQQKDLIRSIISRVTTAIPFTQHDITQMERSKDPHTTIMDYANQNLDGRGDRPPAIPAAPTGIPAGSQFSPSRNQWRDPAGRLYNSAGQPIQ